MSPTSYLDFDLFIESSGADYRASVVNSPAGQASHTFSLPFSEKDLELLVLQVFRLTSRRSVRAIGSPEMTDVRSFGGHLYEALFSGPISTCLLRSMDEADRTQQGLRVRLRLGSTPGLANIPWEFLYDSSSDGFLCLSAETPVVRYLDLPQRVEPLAATPPLRMLCLISSPAGYPPLDVEREWTKLNEALGPIMEEGRLLMERVETPSLEALQRKLRRNEYHILHFIGHGAFDERADDGVLLLEDLEGKGHPVSGESLGVLLHDHDSLRLVILNACEGARTSSADPFAGTAQSLVRKGIPAVIAMQFEISDVAAITLANEFYAAVADGYPVDGALSEARKAIFTRVNAVEWATPVLYMRSPDGRIFEIEDQDERLATREMRRSVVEPQPPPEPEPEPEPAPEPEPLRPSPPKPTPPPEPEPRPDLVRKLIAAAGVLVLAVAGFFIVRALLGGDGTDRGGGGNASLVVVPATTGLDVAEATQRLEAAGLSADRFERPSRTVAEGLVAGTIPAAQAKFPRGGTVDLFVSSGDWIAFVTDREVSDPSACEPCNSEIYLVRPDGTGDPVDLTHSLAADGAPAWSPDGSKVAFVSNRHDPSPRSCKDSCNWEIYVADLQTRIVTRVTNDPWQDGSPTWSPDGKRIAFHSNRNATNRQTCHRSDHCPFEIYVINADGTGLDRLTRNRASDETPRWSPSGETIAFRSNRDGDQEIYAMDTQGRGQTNLTQDPADDAGPSWSPDGEQIAFRRIVGGNFDIYLMDADSSNQHRLTDDPAREAQPTWSPDGSRIAFLFQPQGANQDIAFITLEGGAITRLTEDDGDNSNPAW